MNTTCCLNFSSRRNSAQRLLSALFFFVLLFGIQQTTTAGISKPAGVTENDQELLKVFLDCTVCDLNFIVESIDFVSFVRDRTLAQVHIIVSTHGAGITGENYEISFTGYREFSGIDNKLIYWAPRNNTGDETRQGLVERLKLGLVSYLAATRFADHLSLNLKEGVPVSGNALSDPWKHWVFELYLGANYSREKSKNAFNMRYGLFADKISDTWKIRIRPYFNYNEKNFQTDAGKISSISRRDGFNGYLIRSIDQHWSVGLFSDILASTFHNLSFYWDLCPGIEYSFFPYREASRKSLTLAYKIGYAYNNYLERTVFDREEESLFMHSLKASVHYRQPWGSILASLSGAHYFHDFRANRVEFFTVLNLRLFSGFALSLQGNFDLVNDLLAIPRGQLSLEEILLQQRRQTTDYQTFWSIGLSYTFGSAAGKVVNTRF